LKNQGNWIKVKII